MDGLEDEPPYPQLGQPSDACPATTGVPGIDLPAGRYDGRSASLFDDTADDEAIARVVRERDANDNGERVTLDALLAENGLTREEIENA